MLVGVQDGPLQLKWIYRFAFLLIIVYLLAYGIWGANNLAVNLDNQNTDRYKTLTFFRLAAIGLDIFTPFFTLFYLYNNLFRWVGIIHCYLEVLTIILEVASLVWFALDILDCTNVAHCDGDGMGPLGLDIAFWVLLITLVTRLICNLLFLWINFYIKRRVEVRNILDYYANPNRAPIYSTDPVAALRAGAYPDNFITSDIQDLRLEPSTIHSVSTHTKETLSNSRDVSKYTSALTTVYSPRFSFMGKTILEEESIQKQP